jgi:sugar phosphate isomerase/epimerase
VLEVPVVMAFSGCPGDHEGAKYPNWVTCPWPDDYLKILEWQWNDVVIPYWTEAAAFAEQHGVTKIAFEMHPGFVVYNPETLLKLREAVGPQIGANLDPSHLFWQGVDIVEAIKVLGREQAIFHVHAKDTYLDRGNVARNGVLDTKHYGQILDRSWSFRTVGYGQGEQTWRELVSALRAVDYDDVLSMEHEDLLFSIDEGLRKGVQLLQQLIPREGRTEIWWA